MKYSGTVFSIHPTKGRVERTVVLEEIVYQDRTFWRSKRYWFDREDGRNFNPHDKWSLDITTIVPLEPDSPLLHPVRKPRKTAVRKAESAKSAPAKTPAARPAAKKAGGTKN
jgi:hypothetical protein